MKSSFARSFYAIAYALAAGVLLWGGSIYAEDYVLNATIPGADSWNTASYWTAQGVTSDVNRYFAGSGSRWEVRSPEVANATQTFIGDSLWMGFSGTSETTFSTGIGRLLLKYSGTSEITIDHLYLGNGFLDNGNTGATTVKGAITVLGNSTIGAANNSTLTVQSSITGASGITLTVGRSHEDRQGAVVIAGDTSNFEGAWLLNMGTLRFGSMASANGSQMTINAQSTAQATTLDLSNLTGTFSMPITVSGNGGALMTGEAGITSLAANAALTLTAATAGATAQIGSLTGTGNITKNGAGAVILNAGDTYTGALTVSAGTLGFSGNEGAHAAGITLNGGAVLDFSNLTGTFAVPITVNNTAGTIKTGAMAISSINATGTSTLKIDTSGNAAELAVITGTGATLEKTGEGTLKLTGVSSFTGKILVTGGLLDLSDKAAQIAPAATNGAVTIGEGGTLRVYSFANNANLGNIASANTNRILDGGTLEVLSMENATTGTGDNNKAFQVTAAGGTLRYLGTDTWTLNRTGSGDAQSVLLNGTLTLDVPEAGATMSINNIMLGAGGVTKTGAGTLELNRTDYTYTGATTVTEGTLKTTNIGNLATSSGIILNGGTLWVDGTAAQTLDKALSVTGDSTLRTTNNLAISQGISGAGYALTKTGGGDVSVAGDVTLASLTVSGGNIDFAGAVSIGRVENIGGNVDISDQWLVDISGLGDYSQLLVRSDAGVGGELFFGTDASILVSFDNGYSPSAGDTYTLAIADSIENEENVPWDSLLTFADLDAITDSNLNWSFNLYDVGGYQQLSLAFSGQGGNDVPEPATWVMLLAGATMLAWRTRRRVFAAKKAFLAFACVCALGLGTADAQITVINGETKSAADGTGAVTVNPGGTLVISGGLTIAPAVYPTFTLVGAANQDPAPALQPIIRSTGGDNIINTDITITNRYTQIHADSGTLTINGSIGAGNTAAQVNFYGDGHTITTGAMTTGWINIHNTTWTVDGGTLNIHGTTSVSGHGDYQWNLNNATIVSASGIRNVWPNATLSGTLTLAPVSGGTMNVNGILSGTGGITKTGAGTAVLAGANTYSGPTAVQAGTLRMTGNSTLDGDITITAGTLQIAGTLSGAGTIIHNGVLGGAITDIYRIELENAVVNNDFVINSAAYTGYAGAIYVGSGESTINGDIVVKRGVGNGGHLATAASGATLYLNGALDVEGTNTISHRLGTIVYSGGGSTAYNLNVVGTVKLGADDGLSTQVTLNLGSSNSVGDNGTFDLSGYNQTLARILKSTQNATITNTDATKRATLTVNSAADNDYAGSITGNLNLVKTGNAVLTLSGIASHTGKTTVSGGTLNMGTNGYNAGSYVVENGASLIFAGGTRAHTATDLLAFGDGGGTVQINAGNFYTTVATTISTTGGTADAMNNSFINGSHHMNMNGNNVTFDIAEFSTLEFSIGIGNGKNTGAITKTGDGDMKITGALTSGSNAFGSRFIVSGGTLTLETTNSANVTAGGIIISNGATMVIDQKGSNNQLNTSTAELITFGDGGGTIELKNVNFYSNGASPVTISTTGGAADNIYHSQMLSPTGGSGINMHSKALTFNIAEHSELDIATQFWNNNSGITFSGDGTVNLATNFERTVNLTSNVARLNLKDDVTKTLGSLTVNSGIFSPGGGASDPYGTATIDGGLNLGSGATLLIEIGGESGWDQLDLQLASGSFDANANLVISVLDDYVTTDDPMDIFYGDTTSAFGQQLLAKLDAALAGYDFLDYQVSGGSISLQASGDSAVPEPATWVMLLLGGAAMMLRRRRRVG